MQCVDRNKSVGFTEDWIHLAPSIISSRFSFVEEHFHRICVNLFR
jgi:hypothetical protein